MEQFFDGLERSIADRNWYSALVMSLTLPDICAKVAFPSEGGSRARYARWFDAHLSSTYTRPIGRSSTPLVFLSGNDCYALRCALLHEGSSDISGQRARDVLDEFRFVAPGVRNISWHCNRVHDSLILMVDQFARDILDAARTWWASLGEDERQEARKKMLPLFDSDKIQGI